MVEIVPAVMPKSYQELKESMEAVRELVSSVQIDVMDGKFVPNTSWPYMTIPDPDFKNILEEKEGFPFWDELDFEVDMMIAKPEKHWREWVQAGATRIIIHIESTRNPPALIQEIKKELPEQGSFLYTEIGVALDIDTPTETLDPLLEYIDFVQFMGIGKIGFQGNPFDERVVEKIKKFREKNSTMTISVDGGVSLDTAQSLVQAGANRLAVGSAIFKEENIHEAIRNMQKVANTQ